MSWKDSNGLQFQITHEQLVQLLEFYQIQNALEFHPYQLQIFQERHNCQLEDKSE